MITEAAARTILRAWLDEDLKSVTGTNSIHLHGDEVLKRANREQDSLLRVMNLAYPIVIELLSAQIERFMPILVVTLEVSEVLEFHLPDLEGLEGQLATEPPSIYVVDRNMSKVLRQVESYRRPLPEYQPFSSLRNDVFFFYEVVRSEQDRLRGWEYSRKIYGEQYPTAFRPR